MGLKSFFGNLTGRNSSNLDSFDEVALEKFMTEYELNLSVLRETIAHLKKAYETEGRGVTQTMINLAIKENMITEDVAFYVATEVVKQNASSEESLAFLSFIKRKYGEGILSRK